MGPVPEEEGHKAEEGQGSRMYEGGLVVEEEECRAEVEYRVVEEPHFLFFGEERRNRRRTDPHPGHCGRIPGKMESSHLL